MANENQFRDPTKMIRLIDANDAEQFAREHILDANERYTILDFLRECATVDAVEVVHGRWLQTQEQFGWHDVDCIECSACHQSWIIDEELCFEDYTWNYCSNCGAKMDGDGNG